MEGTSTPNKLMMIIFHFFFFLSFWNVHYVALDFLGLSRIYQSSSSYVSKTKIVSQSRSPFSRSQFSFCLGSCFFFLNKDAAYNPVTFRWNSFKFTYRIYTQFEKSLVVLFQVMHHHIHRRQDFPWGRYTKCYKKKLNIKKEKKKKYQKWHSFKYITQRKKMSSLCLCYSRYISFFYISSKRGRSAIRAKDHTEHWTGKWNTQGMSHFERKSEILIFLFFDMVEVTFFLMDNFIYVQKGII